MGLNLSPGNGIQGSGLGSDSFAWGAKCSLDGRFCWVRFSSRRHMNWGILGCCEKASTVANVGI